MSESKNTRVRFDAEEPTMFFRKLRRVSEAEEWTSKKTFHRALVEISETQEWIATRLEQAFEETKIPGQQWEFPTIDKIQEETLKICDPRSTRHVLLDRFERVKLSKPVEQTRRSLEDLFKRAFPEATQETVDLFILRQLIKSAPESWQLRLREADLKTVKEVEEKIRTLQDAGDSEPKTLVRRNKENERPSAKERAGSSDRCSKCDLRGHKESDCRTRCFLCKETGHSRKLCKKSKDAGSAARRIVPYLSWTSGSEDKVPEPVKNKSEVSEPIEADLKPEVSVEQKGSEEKEAPSESSKQLEAHQVVNRRAHHGERADQPTVRLRPDENLEFKIVLGVAGYPMSVVVDSGCKFNALRRDAYERLAPEYPIEPFGTGMVCMNNTELRVLGETHFTVELQAQEFELRWVIVEGATDKILLGMEGATQLGLVMDARMRRITGEDSEVFDEVRRLEDIVKENQVVFSKDQLDVGVVPIEHCIPLSDDTPRYSKEYRIPVNLEQRARDLLQGMLEKGLIVECASAWAAPALFLEKADKSLRMVVNYQQLNSKTIMDPFPIPDMRTIVRDVAKGRYFTKMDVRNSYWHIPMAEKDQEKTGFVAIGRQFCFRVMPMGLKGAPATLTRALTKTLNAFIQEGIVRVYYDDVVLATDKPGAQRQYHCDRLQEVLACLKRDGWKLNAKKCEFLKRKIDVLGHRISHN